MTSHTTSHMIISVHPQTCQLHFVDPEFYRDKLERAVRALYHPMGVTVSVRIMPATALPHEDYSEDWGVYLITLPGMGEAEARSIRRIAGKVFGGMLKAQTPQLH